MVFFYVFPLPIPFRRPTQNLLYNIIPIYIYIPVYTVYNIIPVYTYRISTIYNVIYNNKAIGLCVVVLMVFYVICVCVLSKTQWKTGEWNFISQAKVCEAGIPNASTEISIRICKKKKMIFFFMFFIHVLFFFSCRLCVRVCC